MNYNEFKEQFVADLKQKFADYDITVRDVKKLNESYEAVTVTPPGSNVGVNIGIDRFYDAIEHNRPYDEVLGKAVETISNGIEASPKVNVGSLGDYEKMKGTLTIEVVSAETNAEMLKTIPHQVIEDLAVVYRFVIDSNELGRSTILVTNAMLEYMGVTPEQLHADAVENAPLIKPAEIKGMSEVMAEMMGIEDAEMMGLFTPQEEQMYVATVPDKVHGAGVLAYQDFMDKAAERAGGDFFILPSSIHELLIVPDNGQMCLRDLENMVREVNATQVAPEDKLTDNVYHYDCKEKIFELGSKFLERQAEQVREVEQDEIELD